MATPRRNSSGLVRDIEILDVLADARAGRDGLGVVEMAGRLGRDKATVSRALSTLAAGGLVERDPETLGYRIGHRIYALAALTAESELARRARPFLRQVARHSGETAHISVLRSGIVLTLLTELSHQEVRTASWEGRSADALVTPSGRVLVSDWTDAELTAWHAEQAERRSLGGSHEVSGLLREVRRIRERGFATSDQELEPGVVAASAPVRDHTDRVVAALNVSAPSGRIAGHLDRLGVYVGKAAARLSLQLGAPDAPPG